MEPIVLHTIFRSSKNSRNFVRLKNGRTVLLKNKLAKEQECEFSVLLKKNRDKWEEMTKNIVYPFRIHFYFYFPDNRRRDLINILQNFADALVREGWIEDDSWQYFMPIFDGAEIDKEDPRVIMWVET